MTAKSTPQLEELRISELHIEPGFNARMDELFKKNLRELKPIMAAKGRFDEVHPITYFVGPDGKKYVRDGHTRFVAAQELGWKSVFAIRKTSSVAEQLAELVTDNAGRPFNQYEQGSVYIRMRDGNAASAKVGEEVHHPMAIKEIAAMVGYSGQHVLNCIAIRESSPAIQEMIVSGAVSANAVTLAKKGTKSDAVAEKILAAAMEEAKRDNKTVATEKHVKAVKDKFVAPKKMRGVSSSDGASSGGEAQASGASEKKDSKKTASAESVDSLGSAGDQENSSSSSDDSSAATRDQSPTLNIPETKKSDNAGMLLAVICQWEDKFGIGLEEKERESLIKDLLNSSVPF